MTLTHIQYSLAQSVIEYDVQFTIIDWCVIIGYMLILVISGFYFNRKTQTNTTDYFLGGRGMPTWAVAMSLMATTLSAATFIGVPDIAYKGDWRYLLFQVGAFVAVVIVALKFIPVFYRENVTSVYELLGHRFGESARTAASCMFMIGRVLASGSRIFMAALPLSLIMFGDFATFHVATAILMLVVVGIGYTLVGGISSVIWADVLQSVVFIGAALIAITLLLNAFPDAINVISDLTNTTTESGTHKLQVFDSGLGPTSDHTLGIRWEESFTLITALTGFVLLNLAAFGTDHDMVQRMLTCRNAVEGSKSTIYGLLMTIPVIALFLLVGSLLYLFYHKMPENAQAMSEIGKQKVFPVYIVTQMGTGVKGLMLAGVFAAGLSSLNSALNAMSATFVSDVYRKLKPHKDEHHYLKVGRIAVFCWGIVLGAFATFCVIWQKNSGDGLIAFALGVMVYAYSGLLAVFATAIFTRRGNIISVWAALITGFTVTLILDTNVWNALGLNESITELTISFPWRMLIATTSAFIVCVSVSQPQSEKKACTDRSDSGE